MSLAPTNLSPEEENLTVSDFISETDWDIQMLGKYLPQEVIEKIRSIPVAMDKNLEDTPLYNTGLLPLVECFPPNPLLN